MREGLYRDCLERMVCRDVLKYLRRCQRSSVLVYDISVKERTIRHGYAYLVIT